MFIDLTYTAADAAQKLDVQQGTTWSLRSKGQSLAISGRTYSNSADALRALEVALGGTVEYRPAVPGVSRREPVVLRRGGRRIEIRTGRL